MVIQIIQMLWHFARSTPNCRNPVIKNLIMYNASMTSNDIIFRQTIFYFCQESIVYMEKNDQSDRWAPTYPVFSYKHFDQLRWETRSNIQNLEFMQKRGSKKDKTKRKQGKQMEVWEKKRPPPQRSSEKRIIVLVVVLAHYSVNFFSFSPLSFILRTLFFIFFG